MSSAAIANAGMIQRSQLVEADAAATPERRVSSSVRATDAAAARGVLPPALMGLFFETPSESVRAGPPSILPEADGNSSTVVFFLVFGRFAEVAASRPPVPC